MPAWAQCYQKVINRLTWGIHIVRTLWHRVNTHGDQMTLENPPEDRRVSVIYRAAGPRAVTGSSSQRHPGARWISGAHRTPEFGGRLPVGVTSAGSSAIRGDTA